MPEKGIRPLSQRSFPRCRDERDLRVSKSWQVQRLTRIISTGSRGLGRIQGVTDTIDIPLPAVFGDGTRTAG
jgi:hypothetical protein